MWIKICGITRPEDAVAAARAGADAIGLNFVGGPRRINPAVAADILAAAPPTLAIIVLAEARSVAGLLADPGWATARLAGVQVYDADQAQDLAVISAAGLDALLVHAVGDPGFADALDGRLARLAAVTFRAIVLDTASAHQQGGTGRAFDWTWLSAVRDAGRLAPWPPVVLAGGLRPDNVAAAIAQTRPWGVDVASGVERSPGRKDAGRMAAFVAAARAAAL